MMEQWANEANKRIIARCYYKNELDNLSNIVTK